MKAGCSTTKSRKENSNNFSKNFRIFSKIFGRDDEEKEKKACSNNKWSLEKKVSQKNTSTAGDWITDSTASCCALLIVKLAKRPTAIRENISNVASSLSPFLTYVVRHHQHANTSTKYGGSNVGSMSLTPAMSEAGDGYSVRLNVSGRDRNESKSGLVSLIFFCHLIHLT